MRILIALALVTVTLAGCSDASSKSDCPDGHALVDGECVEDNLQATKDTGLIRGVVVDETITPLAGAKVTVGGGGDSLELVTDADGRFGADDLVPGVYTIDVGKVGYEAQVTQTEVVAGIDNPDTVRILMPAIEGFAADVLPLKWDGFFQCAAGISTEPAASITVIAANICYLINSRTGMDITNDNSLRKWYEDFVDRNRFPDHTQIETLWTSNQEFAKSLQIRYETSYPDTTSIHYIFGMVTHTSPAVYKIDQEMAAEGDLGASSDGNDPAGLAVEFFPGYDGKPLGMALEQKFTMYIHAFYDYAPPEDWTFHETNEVPRPE